MKILEAVIEMGSTGIRLTICEIDSLGTWTIVDKSDMPISLGRDVFTSGYIHRDTLLQCLRILAGFKEQVEGWGIALQDVKIIATSAMREAKNRDTVADRILIKTGRSVTVIDGIEENRLMYVAVREVLRRDFPQRQNKNSLMLEIGGGSTEIMLLEKGKIATAHSLRLGTVIIDQYIKSMGGSRNDAKRFLEDFIKTAGVNLNIGIDMQKIHQFITIGNDMQLVASHVGTKVGDRTWLIVRENFLAFVDKVEQYSVEECVAKFHISYFEAQYLPVSLLTYKLFLELTPAQEIIVSNTTIRAGLLISKFSKKTKSQEDFSAQILAAALNIGRRYRIDEAHALYVKTMALKIYNHLWDDLGLEPDSKLLLEIAALLHDIGTFIRSGDHHLHSQYIILHTDIFGLTKNQIKIIALITGYHRGAMTLPDDDLFHSLSRAERMCVLKLAAILRIADALDRGHSQRIPDITVLQGAETLTLDTNGIHDIKPEKQAVAEKGDLFEAVFGYTVLIV